MDHHKLDNLLEVLLSCLEVMHSCIGSGMNSLPANAPHCRLKVARCLPAGWLKLAT